METIKNNLQILINKAQTFGLPSNDIQNAQQYLEYNELELCLDILVQQLYEYEISVDSEFIKIAFQLQCSMKLSNDYTFLKELEN